MQIIKLSIPYMPELSKNKRFIGKYSKVKNPAYRKAQEHISMVFKKELTKYPKVYKQKVWIEIFWFKSNLRGDVSNLINSINDSLKVCLDFDDNYFSVKADWYIEKENPRIDIYFKYMILSK